MRASVYARYSTDLQSDRSVEDQIGLCEQYAGRENLQIVAKFSDRARSGGTLHGRDGLAAMLAAAARGEFECLIVEALDRISRDMEGLAAVHKRLTFAGVTIRAVHEGEVNTVLVGLRGLVGQMFREDNAQKIRRGMAGRVREGKSGGGLAYGYAAVPGQPGARVIVPEEAEIVRRIFTEYAAGRSPRTIVRDLNAEGVPPPHGGRGWNASTINGNATRGIGLIRNPIYAGRLEWGRVRMIVHPDTGRRLSRANAQPSAAVDVPDLAIIPPELWAAAVKRQSENATTHPSHQRRPKRLLSGLLRCGACGGPLTCNGKTKSGDPRISCARHKEGQPCPQPRHYPLIPVERAVVRGLREQLLHPDAVAEYVRALHDEQRRTAAEAGKRRAGLERRLADVTAEFNRVVDCIAKGWGDPAILGPRSTALHQEREAAAEALAELGTPPTVIALHPAALTHYQTLIADLERTLELDTEHNDGRGGAELRRLVDAVTVTPLDGRGYTLEIRGRLNDLLGDGAWPDGVQIKAVAGEGISQYLHRPVLLALPFRITVAA